MKRALAIILGVCLLALVFCANIALTQNNEPSANVVEDIKKDETVYALLNNDGSVNTASIVNHIIAPGEGKFMDYGNYVEINNLSGRDEPEVDGNRILWNIPNPNDDFYYEGILEKAELPFTFSFSYFLDGKLLNAKELIGKTGKVEIYAKITPNNKVDSFYKHNFMAQVQIALGLEKCANIEAKGAQSIITGSTNTLIFMVLPGKTGEFRVCFDAKDFEMDGISATITYMDINNMLGMDIEKIKDGTTKLIEGTSELTDGTEKLKEGLNDLVKALDQAIPGLKQLGGASTELATGIKSYAEGVEGISKSAGELSDGLNILGNQGSNLSQGYNEIYSGILQLTDGILAGMSEEQRALYSMHIDGLKQQMQEYGLYLDSYTSGVSEISKGLSSFSLGLSQIAGQSDFLKEGATRISEGVNEAAQGMEKLYSGIKPIPGEVQRLVEGQKQLRDGIKEAMDIFGVYFTEEENSSKPKSFANNTREVESVQFILKTQELRKSEEIDPPAVEEETETFWERLVNLFK